MKKDKEWLKNSIITEKYYTEGRELKAKDSYEEGLAKGTRKGLQTSLNLIDQLEEPEQEKVVVPQFVADFYETVKHLVLSAQFDKFKYAPDKKVWNWYRECEGEYPNPEANAQLVISMIKLGRYEVEKEKLYRVKLLPIDRGYLAQWDGTSLQTGYADEYEYHENCKTKFTEQEIKSIDERYWVFAEEVTE